MPMNMIFVQSDGRVFDRRHRLARSLLSHGLGPTATEPGTSFPLPPKSRNVSTYKRQLLLLLASALAAYIQATRRIQHFRI